MISDSVLNICKDNIKCNYIINKGKERDIKGSKCLYAIQTSKIITQIDSDELCIYNIHRATAKRAI